MRFEDLEVWKRSSRLCVDLYKTLVDLKDYAFKDQLCRAGLSVPCNIAEGIERNSTKDTIRFLRIAKGSCGELRTQVYIGQKIGYIPPEKGKHWVQETKEISAMLMGLIKHKEGGGSREQEAGKKESAPSSPVP